MNIDTESVLRAAGTEWNFLPYRLADGHYIGGGPCYLTHKAETLGYHPQVILAGRRINDGMGAYVAGQLIKAMLRRRIQVEGSRVLILGLTFKENCPDMRNTRVIDLVSELRDYGVEVDVHDPWVDPTKARQEYGLELVETPEADAYDAVILAVAHDSYREAGAMSLRSYGRPDHVLCDLKSVLARDESDLRL